MRSDVAARIETIKRRLDSESEMNDWHQLGFAAKHGAYLRTFRDRLATALIEGTVQPILSVEARDLSPGRFQREFDKAPVIIKGLVDESSGWRGAKQNWQRHVIWENDAYGREHFEVGKDDDGHPVKISLQDMLQYELAHTDDTPIYIFCNNISTPGLCPMFKRDYTNFDQYFPEDLMSFRTIKSEWLLVGPAGSGSDVHRDPPGSVAWNALLEGTKIWACVHPSLTAEEVGFGMSPDDEPPLQWFREKLPSLWEKFGGADGRVRVGIQPAGSVICLPPNWWHAVWNAEPVFGATQNLVSWRQFCTEWESCRISIAKQQQQRRAREDEGKDTICGDAFRASSSDAIEDDMNMVARVAARFDIMELSDAYLWLEYVRGFCIESGKTMPLGLAEMDLEPPGSGDED